MRFVFGGGGKLYCFGLRASELGVSTWKLYVKLSDRSPKALNPALKKKPKTLKP